MFEIPVPPPPEIPALWAWTATGGGLVVGTAMLLWGRHLHRAFLVLAGAGAGVALAEPLSGWLDFNIVLLRIVPAVVLAIVGFVAARLIWALLGGALASLITATSALLVAMYRAGAPVGEAPPTETLAEWPAESAMNLFNALSESGYLPLALGGSLLVGAAVALVLLLRPVAGRIIMTSLLATAVLMGALLLASINIRDTLWQTMWEYPLVPAAGAVALVLLGWIWQFVCAGRERRSEREKQKQKEKAEAEDASARKA